MSGIDTMQIRVSNLEKQLAAATQAREQAEKRADSALCDNGRLERKALKLCDQIDSLTAANAGLVEALEEWMGAADAVLSAGCTSGSFNRHITPLYKHHRELEALAAQQEGGEKPVVCPSCMSGAVKRGPKNDRARCLSCKSEWEIRHGRPVITQEQAKKMDNPLPPYEEGQAIERAASGDRRDLLRYLRLKRTR